MTLSPFIIYLWGIADNLQTLFCILGIIFGIAALFTLLFANIERGGFATPEGKRLVRPFAITACLAFVCAACAALTPSSKTLAIMVVAPAIVNSKPIQQDLPEVYSLAVDALKQSLKDVAIEQTK